MKKTIELTPKFTKWGFIFNGIFNTAIGINLLFQSDSWFHWTSILAIFLVIAGPMVLIYGIILFNPFNKFAPKVQIDDQGLLIKNDIHKKLIKIDWEDIQEITYKTFELDFLLNNNNMVTVNLPTTANKSVEIKRTIRNFTEMKNIKIIGG